MLYNIKLSHEEQISTGWFSLLLDIRTQIIDYLPEELWEWFAIHDNEIRDYSLKYRKYYIDKYTVKKVKYSNTYKTWKILEKYHREPENGVSLPAIIDCDEKQYFINNSLHRNPDENGNDLPAIEGNHKIAYYCHGIKHRNPDKYGNIFPTIIKSIYKYASEPLPINEHDDTRKDYTFKYYKNGHLHRDDVNGIPEPAIIRNRKHKVSTKYEYFQNGAYYRSDGGPELITHDDCEYWLLNMRNDDYIRVIDDYVFINAPDKYVISFDELQNETEIDTTLFLWFINIMLAFITTLSF